jgi:hypothetical protein
MCGAKDGPDAPKDEGLLYYLQQIPFAAFCLRSFASSRLFILLGLIVWKKNLRSVRVFRRIVARSEPDCHEKTARNICIYRKPKTENQKLNRRTLTD